VSLRRRRNQRGDALLEGALTFLTTLLLILGSIDLGQMLMQLHLFGERARTTARWASTTWDQSCDSGTNCWNASNLTAVKNYAAFGQPTAPSGADGFFGLQPSHVTVTTIGTPNTVAFSVSVSISKPLSFYSPYLYGSYTMRPAKAVSPIYY
jgi:Flp pilus assembly protein TadG